MASVGDKAFKQDLIVSARYKNDLPPPPMPPKFLDIDTGGISNYLTTSYASSLLRREEPNIDVDAEGGMPIDMIGVPGYFLGDESAIMAPERPPILDPADQELLLSVEQIKAQSSTGNVSFLRKTQYLSSSNSRSSDLFTKNNRQRQQVDRKVEPVVDRDDKENVRRTVQKSFDLAYPDSIPYNIEGVKQLPRTNAEREAWDKPKHPTGAKDIFPVDFYPVLPDFEATNDQGDLWQRFKFDKPPLPADQNRRDDRIDVATFQTIPNEALMPEWQAKKDAYDQNPEQYADPGPEPFIWVMAIPESTDVSKIRTHLYDGHPDKDDTTLIETLVRPSTSSEQRVRFERKRVFQSVNQQGVDPRRLYAVGTYDPTSTKNFFPPSEAKRQQGKAAYIYPIGENVRFKADRSKIANPTSDIEQQLADDFMLRPKATLNPREVYDRGVRRAKYDYAFRDEFEKIKQVAEAYEEDQQAQAIEELEEEGQGDVSMAEAQDDETAAPDQKSGTRAIRDDDDDDDEDLQDHGGRNGQAAVQHGTGSSDEELMEDD